MISTPPGAAITRAFVRIAHGSIHLRTAGPDAASATPLVMLHGGPGSSAGLQQLIAALAGARRVIAPDMMGNGDSDPPPHRPDIEFYAECLRAVLDQRGVDRIDIYGHHTGAQVACEFAIAHPARVRRLVLDGAALFPASLRQEFLTRYAPPLNPDADGRHLAWIWDFARRLTERFPHYSDAPDDRLTPATVMPPAAVTAIAAEVLKNWSTFHLCYDAAFRHELRSRLPLVQAPALVLEIAGDPLARYVGQVVALMRDARSIAVGRDARAAAIDAFLTAQ